MLVDASAIVAILTREPERAVFLSKIAASPEIRTTPIAVFEAALAVSRKSLVPMMQAEEDVLEFMRESGIEQIPINHEIGSAARLAHARFGKGTGHPARLNMGDCFSYSAAKSLGLPLLFKGDDFSQTDIEAA